MVCYAGKKFGRFLAEFLFDVDDTIHNVPPKYIENQLVPGSTPAYVKILPVSFGSEHEIEALIAPMAFFNCLLLARSVYPDCISSRLLRFFVLFIAFQASFLY